jgi:uncharacterized protein YggU (UPF0235/DUF167 family)
LTRGDDRPLHPMRDRIIEVRVKPRARYSCIEDAGDGTFVAHVKAAPLDGKANDEVIDLVARHFGCRRTAVSIKSGAGARRKWLKLEAAPAGSQRRP